MGTPIINQPQVGILALGAIRKMPSVIETSEGDKGNQKKTNKSEDKFNIFDSRYYTTVCKKYCKLSRTMGSKFFFLK